MAKSDNKSTTTFELSEQNTLNCGGSWTRREIPLLNRLAKPMENLSIPNITIDGSGVASLDTAGAWFILKFIATLKERGVQATVSGFSEEQQALFSLIDTHSEFEITPPKKLSFWVTRLGESTVTGVAQSQQFIAFVGEIFMFGLHWLSHPWQARYRSIAVNIQTTGSQAIPIVALLSFLIGVVLAYQVGVQLRDYGANSYVVDFIGLAILREFGPLITAIIIAGRTGSAFAAQIGTMKLNEEVDAIKTIGLSPIDLLVMPKVAALVIALPLLVILSEICGVIGGMFMSKLMLGITFTDFLDRFDSVIDFTTYFVGMIKTPFFALLIASIGCFQGFQVKDSAESVGRHTTISVVQAIFMIIVTDAAFSILYSWLDI